MHHLADVFIQSDLQKRTIAVIKSTKEQQNVNTTSSYILDEIAILNSSCNGFIFLLLFFFFFLLLSDGFKHLFLTHMLVLLTHFSSPIFINYRVIIIIFSFKPIYAILTLHLSSNVLVGSQTLLLEYRLRKCLCVKFIRWSGNQLWTVHGCVKAQSETTIQLTHNTHNTLFHDLPLGVSVVLKRPCSFHFFRMFTSANALI